MKSDSDFQTQFAFPKAPRIKNPDLLAVIRKLPCMACVPGSQAHVTEAHHITTRGAWGDDVPENVMPLCTLHHSEWHSPQGPGPMIKKYPCVRTWLDSAGRSDILNRYSGKKLSWPKD